MAILLFLSALAVSFRCASQDAWYLYKEAPVGLVPVQIEQTNDGRLYVMTNRGAMLYRESTDEMWTPILNIQSWWNATSFAIDPETNRLFVNTWLQGLRYTDNLGENWSVEHFFTTDFGLHANVRDILPFDGSATVLVASGLNPIEGTLLNYRSTNNGANWQSLPAPGETLALFRTSSGRIIGVMNNLGVFVSDDNGSAWLTTGFQGVEFGDFAETNDGVIYATASDAATPALGGVWSSTDDGLTWSQRNEGLPEFSANSISYSGANERLLLAANHGIYERIGDAWVPVANTFEDVPVYDVFATAEHLYAALPVLGVQSTSSNAIQWAAMNEGFPLSMDTYAFNSENGLIAAYSQSLGVFSAAQADATWDVQFLDESSVTPQTVMDIGRAPDGTMYIMDFDEIFISDDDGNSFQNITPNLPNTPGGTPTQFKEMRIAANGEILLLRHVDNRVFHSVNGGQSFEVLLNWNDINQPFIVNTVCRSDQGHYYCVVQTTGGHLFIHSSNGADWQPVDLGMNLDPSTAVGFKLVRAPSGEILITLNHVPFVISDDDQTLTPVNVPWTFENPNAVFELAIDEQGNYYVLVAPTLGSLSYTGIWRTLDGGASWENLGFPLDEFGEAMEATRLGFNLNNVPFVISGEIFSDRPIGLYYFGTPGMFTTVSEQFDDRVVLILYPNPLKATASLVVESSLMRVGDRVQIIDTALRVHFEAEVTIPGRFTMPSGALVPGMYIVCWFGSNGTSATQRLVVD